MPKTLAQTWLRSARAHWPYYLCVLAIAVLCWKLWASGPKDIGKVLQAIEKAHAAGDAARVEDYVQAWLPRLGKVHFLLCCALLLAGPWLIGIEKDTPIVKAKPPANRSLWIITTLMIVCAAGLNSPRLFHSFWGDEEWTARRFVIGEFRTDEQGHAELHKPNWTKTLFFYRDPNNHPMFSALARLSASLVPAPTAKDEFYFREWPIRLPAFLFGLASLAALAWLASGMGLARAGSLAVLWLSLHPWYVRYSVDARGYALLLTLLPLCLGCLWRAITRGNCGWWLGFGLTEFLALWAYPGALYFVLLMNLIACGMLVTCPPPSSRWLQWRRFATANVIGAMLTSLMLAPLVQSMLLYLQRERIRGELTPAWIAETMSALFTGLPWAKWADHEMALSWARTWAHAPALVITVFAMLIITLAAGTLALWQRGVAYRWIAMLTLGTGPFIIGMAMIQGNILYPWYLIVCLPCIAILFGAGLEHLAMRLQSDYQRAALVAAALVIFAMATWPQVQLLRHHATEPMRESVMATRPERNPLVSDPSNVLTASIMFPSRLYDPMAEPIESVEALRQLMQQADSSKKPLFVNFADLRFFTARYPDLWALLGDTSKFTALPPVLGIDSQPERQVFKYKGLPDIR